MNGTHSTLDGLLASEQLSAAFQATIDALCRPLAMHAMSVVRAADRCVILGICGAQGSGKSTIASVLCKLLQAEGCRVATVSLDDFYLTRPERAQLAARVHPLLRTRGVPGTHDVALAMRTLVSLQVGSATTVPVFDKARDDRCVQASWPVLAGPQIVIFEGWCVGVIPQSSEQLRIPLNDLERSRDAHGVWRQYVNAALAGRYQQLFAMIDRLVLLAAPDFDVVARWRCEQERKLRERIEHVHGDRSHTMNDAQVRQFVMHFERLTRHVLTEMPARANAIAQLDASRRVLQVDFRSW